MELYQRKIKFTAGGKEFDGDNFTIKFKIPFSTSENPDVSEIEIYNLSQDSIAAIENKAYAILNAGYKGDIGNILTGKVENTSTEWKGVDKITTITISDGGFEWRNTTIQKTYQAGTTAKYIMQELAGLLGLEVVEIEPKNNITYKLGRTISGNVEKVLEGLVEDTDSKMYISKGKLYIRDTEKGTETGFVLNSGSGLLGSPEKVIKDGTIKYNVKCLLNHKINTDSLIQIESNTASGTFRVAEGTHKCSENDFITEMVVM